MALFSNVFIFSATCDTLDTTWEKLETTPELPVNHGDTIQLSCQTGYSLAGSDTATCNDGQLDISGRVPPFCFGKFSDGSDKLRHLPLSPA